MRSPGAVLNALQDLSVREGELVNEFCDVTQKGLPEAMREHCRVVADSWSALARLFYHIAEGG